MMPLIFERVSSRQSTGSFKSRSSLVSFFPTFDLGSESSSCSLIIIVQSNEEPLTGTQKIPYRPGEDWDYDAFTESAPIDVSLAMPPHRPRHQPEHHRTSMLLSSESGPIRAKVVSLSLPNTSIFLPEKSSWILLVTAGPTLLEPTV